MFYNYAIVKPTIKVENKDEFVYKTLKDIQQNLHHYGDSIEEGILSVLNDNEENNTHKPIAWHIEEANLYILKTDCNFRMHSNTDILLKQYTFPEVFKTQWKELFKKLINENRVYDITTTFTNYDFEKLSEILYKEEKTTSETEEAITIFNNIMDERPENLISSSISIKYKTPNGDLSFEIDPFLIMYTNPFYCNRDVDAHVEEAVIEEYVPIVLQEVLTFFELVKDEIVLNEVDISDNIKVKHPLSDLVESAEITLDTNLSHSNLLSNADLFVLRNYFKSQLSTFKDQKVYPWEASEFIKKHSGR